MKDELRVVHGLLTKAITMLAQLGERDRGSYELAFARREAESARIAVDIVREGRNPSRPTWQLQGAWAHAMEHIEYKPKRIVPGGWRQGGTDAPDGRSLRFADPEIDPFIATLDISDGQRKKTKTALRAFREFMGGQLVGTEDDIQRFVNRSRPRGGCSAGTMRTERRAIRQYLQWAGVDAEVALAGAA
jgi:hypothetical protein